tara:strand:- start:644 stop:1189 length:546 start_codon:yes stop_codon:yes gene_type:complete
MKLVDNMKMYNVESLGLECEKPILGIFGTESFTNISKGEVTGDRRRAVRKIISLLKGIEPRLVYIIPRGKTCLYATHLLRILDIPFSLIIPCTGYFDNLRKFHNLKFEKAVEGSQSIIILSDETLDLKNSKRIEDEAENFIVERAELILSIYGSTLPQRYKNLNKKLNNVEGDVIFLNYSQ